MSATIKRFQVGEKRFSHLMNSAHDSIDLRDDVNATLLTYGADSRVSNQHGRVGRFVVEYLEGQPLWVYYEMSGQTRHVYGADLRMAQVAVSKRFIGSTSPELTTQTGL